MPVTHSSSIDKLLDYMPDLIEKTTAMMNKKSKNDKRKNKAKETESKMEYEYEYNNANEDEYQDD